jgi:hypothetical protein
MAASTASAQPSPAGPYMALAVGVSEYETACASWYADVDCSGGNGTTGKIIGGYRFGTVGVEASWADFGSANYRHSYQVHGTQRLRALGLGAVFYANFSPTWNGLLRTGAARTTYQSTGSRTDSHTSPYIGLGLVANLTPTWALELAIDNTFVLNENSNTFNVPSLTGGLRVRF